MIKLAHHTWITRQHEQQAGLEGGGEGGVLSWTEHVLKYITWLIVDKGCQYWKVEHQHWVTDSSPALSNYFLNVLHNGKDLIFRYAITRSVSLHVPDLVQSILYNITLWNYKELKTLFQHHSYVHYEWFKTQKFYGALYLSKRTLKPTDRETVSSLELTNKN